MSGRSDLRHVRFLGYLRSLASVRHLLNAAKLSALVYRFPDQEVEHA